MYYYLLGKLKMKVIILQFQKIYNNEYVKYDIINR